MPWYFNRWVFYVLVPIIAIAAHSWRDVAEQSADSVRGLLGSGSPYQDATIGRLASQAIRLERQRNDAAQVSTSELQFESRTAAEAVVSIRLISRNQGNDYPHLVVSLKSSLGTLLRTVDLDPTQYEHGTELEDERVRFTIELHSGEQRIAIRPLYLSAGPTTSTSQAGAGAAASRSIAFEQPNDAASQPP
jgi:hypothetical protein